MDSWCLNPDFLMVCEHVTKEFLHIINFVLFLPVCTWQAKAVMYKNHTACQVQSILKMHFFCKNLVANLDVEALRRLALELLRRQPAAFVDLVNGELPVQGELPSQEQEDEPEDRDPPPEGIPEWCFCGHCAPMPTQEENKCCSRLVMPCLTTNPLFNQLVLDANVLDIAMRYREDILVMEHPRNNENFRHSAYRQFVL